MEIITNGEVKTGYPHIDRPWMKWLEKSEYQPLNIDTNITDYLRIKNQNHGAHIAEIYYSTIITYDELFEKIDAASRALTAIGATKGKTIFNLMPNIPEAGQIWLGAAQIGAISDFADPRPDSMDMKANALKVLELLKYEKADYIVALDKCYTAMLKPIENEIKELGINNIVVVSASDSMNIKGIINYLIDIIKYNSLKNERLKDEAVKKLKFYQALYEKIQGMSQDKKMLESAIQSSPIEIIRYKDLLESSKKTPFVEIKDGNLVSYIGHTSGTSGARPKPIPLTNKNQIFATEQAFKMGVNVNPKERVLHELPFFSPLGADNNYLLDLASGATLIDIPEFDISEFGYLIKRHHPNIIMGTPSWIESLPSCKYLKKKDLIHLTRVIYGGDSMSKPNEVKTNTWLKNNGSRAVIEKGHGMSEYCGGGTYATGAWNCYESIGIPFPDTIYAIVDPNIEDRLVPIKEKDKDGYIHGELVVSSEAITPGVLNGNTIVPKFVMDGKEYIRTRDLVKMNEDGIFFFEARKDRSFTRFDGYKVKPGEIEKEIEKNSSVQECKISYYYDTKRRGLMPIAHIVLTEECRIHNFEDYIRIVEEIVYEQIIANPNMSTRQVPSKFKFRSEMPLTKNSKVNFKALAGEALDGSEINVDIEETNLAVSGIKIYSNETVKELKKA